MIVMKTKIIKKTKKTKKPRKLKLLGKAWWDGNLLCS